jgi:D-arabinose 1-dehydrogenase-like Zn-dependent alcohol dehydrogenase
VTDLPTTMRAARLHALPTEDTHPDVRIDELPVPEPGYGEVLVRVLACGVCASDLHVVAGVTPAGDLPQTLGHEAVGDIAALGEDVDGWAVGDRVLILPAWPCFRCGYCLGGRENLCRSLRVPGVDVDGAQAGFALADARVLVHIPRSVPVEQAAILVDAVATPYHALKRAGVTRGSTVAIVGLGGLGMHAVQLARLAGAETIIGVDIDPVNLERAEDWGADEVVDASDGTPARRVRELTEGGVEKAIEFVGSNATIDQAVKMLAPGGRAVAVGLTPEALQTLPSALLVANELELVGSFGSSLADVNELVDLLDAGRLDLTRSVTHTYGLDAFTDALTQLHERTDHPIRIVVTH